MTRYEFSYVPYRGLYFPIIPLQIKSKNEVWIAIDALVDSGASISLFQVEIAKILGLEVEEGSEVRPTGIGGSVKAYVHRVVLRIGEEEFESDVAFTEELAVPINLLGRADVFDHFLVSFNEKRKKVVFETLEG